MSSWAALLSFQSWLKPRGGGAKGPFTCSEKRPQSAFVNLSVRQGLSGWISGYWAPASPAASGFRTVTVLPLLCQWQWCANTPLHVWQGALLHQECHSSHVHVKPTLFVSFSCRHQLVEPESYWRDSHSQLCYMQRSCCRLLCQSKSKDFLKLDSLVCFWLVYFIPL